MGEGSLWLGRAARPSSLTAGAQLNIIMKVEITNMAVFRYRDNEMWSGYIPQEVRRVIYIREDKVIEKEKLSKHSFHEISFRAVTHLSKDCGAKYSIWLTITILVFLLIDR